MGNPIVHWEIAGSNREKLQSFYASLFDWMIEDAGGMNYGMVKTGTAPGGGIAATEGKMPPHLTIYVQVDDLQASLDKAVSLGGKAIVPPTPIPNIGSFAMFADLEGNVVGIFKE